MFEESFEVTEMRTFKHEPFYIIGGGGERAYLLYFTVIYTLHTVHVFPCLQTPCMLITTDRARDVLKDHLMEELDYYLLPKPAWEKLLSWYGLSEGSQPIERSVCC